MAIFDGLLGSSFEDPRTMGALALASGLLSAPRASQGLASGLLGYQQAIAQGKKAKSEEEERALRRQAQELQLQQAQQQAAQLKRQQDFLQSLPSPQFQSGQNALAAGGGPTLGNAAQIQPVDQRMQQLLEATRAGVVSYPDYLAATRKDTTPVKLGAGETLLDPRTFKPLASNPKEESSPSAVREYEFARQQGYPGSFLDFQLAQKKAGATSVNVNTAKPLLNTVAEGLGKQIDASLENARAAIPAIQTAQSLKSAIDSGKVVSGPGASFRVTGLQIGQMLGIGGNSGAEVLSNTRQAIQSMAQAELNAAAQMKGQGQITESERDIIRRAASGRIDDLTGPEIKQLADVMEKTARFKIKQHQQNVGRLQSMPEAAPLVPFYSIDEPPAYSAPNATRVRRYNPATGRIE